ncbi:hypothetical protein D9611_002146 [Ephemerocybe angulata]|uniref:Uncharacterized protein n=1 Tax=Ephemerocybe angulata TaxID=980116 RepID=A0A8H5CH52_9AGAR|nr:hypothetical protein D9611_002146 [Tulosesus angulatus]
MEQTLSTPATHDIELEHTTSIRSLSTQHKDRASKPPPKSANRPTHANAALTSTADPTRTVLDRKHPYTSSTRTQVDGATT